MNFFHSVHCARHKGRREHSLARVRAQNLLRGRPARLLRLLRLLRCVSLCRRGGQLCAQLRRRRLLRRPLRRLCTRLRRRELLLRRRGGGRGGGGGGEGRWRRAVAEGRRGEEEKSLRPSTSLPCPSYAACEYSLSKPRLPTHLVRSWETCAAHPLASPLRSSAQPHPPSLRLLAASSSPRRRWARRVPRRAAAESPHAARTRRVRRAAPCLAHAAPRTRPLPLPPAAAAASAALARARPLRLAPLRPRAHH